MYSEYVESLLDTKEDQKSNFQVTQQSQNVAGAIRRTLVDVLLRRVIKKEHNKAADAGKVIIVTLQGINISHLGKRKIIFKMPFFGDMLVSWRVLQ